MKTLKLAIVKKGRVWFDCKNAGGYKCKLKINEISQNFEPGEVEVTVNDLSVRSKYGTELKYEPVGEMKKDEVVTLKHDRFNCYLVSMCKQLGGKWDSEERAWVFPSFLEDKVEKLEEVYNSELITVEITSKDYISQWHDSVDFCGYPLARAWGRDSGAELGEGVSLFGGEIHSGGSMKNWTTVVEEGTTFRLQVPKALLEIKRDHEERFFEIKEV